MDHDATKQDARGQDAGGQSDPGNPESEAGATRDPTPLTATMRRRRMIRSFTSEPLGAGQLDQLLDTARRAPSAGNTQAVEFLVLDQPDAVAAYWEQTLPLERRAGFRWVSLLDAPALVVVLTRPDGYVERYAEPDKARPGLGEGVDGWSVPFWWVDAGAVIQNLLLLVTDDQLGACIFGLFGHEGAVLSAFGVPDDYRAVATIAIGHPDPVATARSQDGRSARRARRPIEDITHRGRWSAPMSRPMP